MRIPDPKAALFLLPALPLVLAAGVLHWMPARGYAVSCERTAQVRCTLERTEAAGTTRTLLPLDDDASAVVRVHQQRRGDDRIFLYLESPPRSVFAAEFEDGDAYASASAAAEQLNRVLRAQTPGLARIEVTAPTLYRRLAWLLLVVMGLLLFAGYRRSRSPAPPPAR